MVIDLTGQLSCDVIVIDGLSVMQAMIILAMKPLNVIGVFQSVFCDSKTNVYY